MVFPCPTAALTYYNRVWIPSGSAYSLSAVPTGSYSRERTSEMCFSTIPEAIAELKAGRMIVLTDDENRENEGDLVCAAEKVSPENRQFHGHSHGRGMICMPLTGQKCDQLMLHPQTSANTAPLGTAFTVTVDAPPERDHGHIRRRPRRYDHPSHRRRLPTGRPDPTGTYLPPPCRRWRCARQTRPNRRLGRTWRGWPGSSRLGVICEIMNKDGSMARLPQLTDFCGKHGLKIISVAALVEYRLQREKLVERVQNVELPTDCGVFRLIGYRSIPDWQTALGPMQR